MRDRLITSSSFKHGLTTLGFNLSDEVRRARLSSVWRAPSVFRDPFRSYSLGTPAEMLGAPACLLRYRSRKNPLSIDGRKQCAWGCVRTL